MSFKIKPHFLSHKHQKIRRNFHQQKCPQLLRFPDFPGAPLCHLFDRATQCHVDALSSCGALRALLGDSDGKVGRKHGGGVSYSNVFDVFRFRFFLKKKGVQKEKIKEWTLPPAWLSFYFIAKGLIVEASRCWVTRDASRWTSQEP